MLLYTTIVVADLVLWGQYQRRAYLLYCHFFTSESVLVGQSDDLTAAVVKHFCDLHHQISFIDAMTAVGDPCIA